MAGEDNTDLEQELSALLEVERFEPPEEFREGALWSDPGDLRGGGGRSRGLVEAPGDRAARLGRGAERRARRLQPALLQVVRRRQDQRLLQLPRPPRRGGPRRSRRLPLARRGGRGARRHLRRAAGRYAALRQRVEGPRRRQGRRGRDLPADDPRGRRRDAGDCAGSGRCTTSSSAASRPKRCASGWSSPRRRRWSPSTAPAARARWRRSSRRSTSSWGTWRRWRRSSSSATPASIARCARGATASTTSCCEAADAECPAEPLDAEQPLFILYTSGSTAKPKGILHTTGGYLTGVAATHRYVFDLKPEERRLLVRGRRRLGHRPLLHRLRAAAQRRHQRDVGGGARLPEQGHLVGAGRALRGDDPLHGADRDPHLHQVGGGHPGQVGPLLAAAAGLGRRADQPQGLALVPQGDRRRNGARSSTPGGRPRPARS